MNILLIQAMGYFISYSGACKANRYMMEGLAELGHSCQVITIAPNDNGLRDNELLQARIDSGEITVHDSSDTSDVYSSHQVMIHAVKDLRKLKAYVDELAERFAPDWILVTEDRVPEALEAALEAAPGRVVEIAHSQVALPFGPESYGYEPRHLELLQNTSGILASSRYLKNYLKEWGPFEAELFHFPVHGKGPFRHYHNFDSGYITMVNPSDIKGLPIFMELARQFPRLPFAAVPTWATTDDNLQLLRSLPNMTILNRVDDIDEIIRQTRVLIVPSLWGEAFGAIIVDGLLRGIPVLASNVGGTSEAKLGTEYLLPVQPIARYGARVDQRLIPIPDIPEQDMKPWLDALEKLTADREHYEAVSAHAKKAADDYLAAIDLQTVVDYLGKLEKLGCKHA